jgi:phage N-6-adenine-methyltransferase
MDSTKSHPKRTAKGTNRITKRRTTESHPNRTAKGTNRRTIDGSTRPAVVNGMRARNNGRYNGNGREWETPAYVFDPLNKEFNFTRDPCATRATAKCKRFFTEADDGLARDWGSNVVFMNPPYGKEIYPWTRKARLAAECGATVVGLLPASTDLAWWHDDVVGHAEVRYHRGRVRFLNGGPYTASGFFPSVIVIWRPKRLAAGE